MIWAQKMTKAEIIRQWSRIWPPFLVTNCTLRRSFWHICFKLILIDALRHKN